MSREAIGPASRITLTFVFLIAGLLVAEARPLKIAFVGDSMADGLWGAFFRLGNAQKCGSDVMDFIRDARNGSGLARPDHFDWEKDLDDLVQDQQPDLVLASIGLNDRQSLVTRDNKSIRLGSDEWLSAYRVNVESFYRHATRKGARALVVGLPVLRDAKADKHARLVNTIFSDVAQSEPDLKTTYVDPWQASDSAAFASFGESLSGATVQIRAPDGVHFTQAGYDILAAYLKPKVIEALQGEGLTVDISCFGQ